MSVTLQTFVVPTKGSEKRTVIRLLFEVGTPDLLIIDGHTENERAVSVSETGCRSQGRTLMQQAACQGGRHAFETTQRILVLDEHNIGERGVGTTL